MFKKGLLWPIAISSFLLFIVVFNIGFAVLASKTATAKFVSQPYEKGLVYEDEINLERVAKKNNLKLNFIDRGNKEKLKIKLELENPAAEIAELALELWRPDGLIPDFSPVLECTNLICQSKLESQLSGLWYYRLRGTIAGEPFLYKGSQSF